MSDRLFGWAWACVCAAALIGLAVLAWSIHADDARWEHHCRDLGGFTAVRYGNDVCMNFDEKILDVR